MTADKAAKPLGRLGTAADLDRGPGGKVRLVSMVDLDRRTKAAQIATATKDAIENDLGGGDRLSTLERIMVENVAMSAAVLRDAHVRWLKGEPVPATEIATLENTFNRTAAALGTARRARDVTPTLDAYLAPPKIKETD